MAAQLKDLTLCLKKIGGIQSLDNEKKKNSSRSTSVPKDTDSTGPIAEVVPPMGNVTDVEVSEVETEILSRKRKNPPEVGSSAGATGGTGLPTSKGATTETYADAPVRQL